MAAAVNTTAVNKRRAARRPLEAPIDLQWNAEGGDKRLESCRLIDISDTGVRIELPEALPLLQHVLVRMPALNISALAQVKHCEWTSNAYTAGLSLVAKTGTAASDKDAPDYYEILRLDPSTAPDAIERVYHTLARRYHPDNERTGDAEIFLRVVEAYRILNDPRRRQKYDQKRDTNVSLVPYQLLTPEFHAGLRGEQNRRITVLCLLYRRRSSDFEFPGLTVLDLERMSGGFTREELGFAMWYLCEKGYAKIDDSTRYCITSLGADFVENTVINERPELKPVAVPEPASVRA
jgi:hypothetical protein